MNKKVCILIYLPLIFVVLLGGSVFAQKVTLHFSWDVDRYGGWLNL